MTIADACSKAFGGTADFTTNSLQFNAAQTEEALLRNAQAARRIQAIASGWKGAESPRDSSAEKNIE